MHPRTGTFKRFRRSLFVGKENPEYEKRSLDETLEFHMKSGGSYGITNPDVTHEKEPLSDIESYSSSDDVDETNETIIECYSEQDDECRIHHSSTINRPDSSPGIVECSWSENSEFQTSPILQPVAVADSDDEGSAYSIASDKTMLQSPNSSVYYISDRSSLCSSPERTGYFLSPSQVISVSPFKSPNVKREVGVNSECRNYFKTPDNKPTTNTNTHGSDRKREKYLKGGFAEQFEKLSSKEQTNQAIWRLHKQTMCLNEEKDDTLLMKVVDVKKHNSNTFAACQNLNDNSDVIVMSTFIQSLKLESGNIIKIYEPWKTFKSEEIRSNIIRANFIEVIDRCADSFPKISRCVLEWSCLCIKDSVIEPRNCTMLPSSHTKINSGVNPFLSILDCAESKDFFLLVHVQRVFHYFLEPSKMKWSFLIQDKSGIFSELDLKFVDSKWLPLIRNAEGRQFCLGPLCLRKKLLRNRSAKLFSMIHTLQNMSDTKFNNYQQFCFVLTCVSENFTIFEASDNLQFYVSPDSQTIIRILMNCASGCRYSSIVKVLLVHEDKLFVTDESCTSKTQKNYVRVLRTSEVIQCLHLEAGCILYLKDFELSYGIFLLDKYSRVFSLTCKTCAEPNLSLNYDPKKIETLKSFSPILQNLTSSHKDEECVTFCGTILKPDEESSVSWPVCGVCGNEKLHEIENGNIFCNICDCTAQNPVMKMHLEIFVTNQSLPENITVKLKLTNRTIENLLPSIGDDCYDVQCIIDKQIGPFNCFIEQVHPLDDSDSQLYILSEV